MSADGISIHVGDILECTVEEIAKFGALVRLSNGQRGLIHVSEISNNYIKDVSSVISVNDKVKAKVIKIDDKGKIGLSLKRLENSYDESDNFEKKVASFLKVSESKITDLNTRNYSRNGNNIKRRNHKNRD